jgi:hypothetical protein
MNTLHFSNIAQAFRAACAIGLAASAISAAAQVNTASPTVFSLAVATGGTAATTATPIPTNGTGDRQAIANMCSSLIVGGSPGVSTTNLCAPGTIFSSVSVGAAANSGVAQSFNASYSAAQLAGFIPTLAAAGQPFGSRKFYVVTQFLVSAVLPPSATRFVTLEVNLIEPPPLAAGITNATASLIDVAPSAPSPINVRYAITGTDTPLAGQFCSSLLVGYPASGVSAANPCAPASLLGNAGPAVGFVNAAQTGESLIVSETVARQATARAQASGNGIFYFTRQFSSGKFAVVQLRLNANSANTPLAFTDIRLGFKDGGSLQNIGFFKRGQVLPAVSAALRYRGAGVLRARWEIVQPNDTPPTALDLQAEASLTPLQRVQQQRYRVLDRVTIYLPATGQAVLSGPAPRLLPNEQYGQYLLLLRIESSESIAGVPAGTAPFVLPVLRYYIGESSGPAASAKLEPQAISLISPASGATLPSEGALAFQWLENKSVSLYRLEIEANGKQVFAARVRPNAQEGTNRYTAPPFIAASLVNKASRWRVVALASDGQFVGESEWRDIASTP